MSTGSLDSKLNQYVPTDSSGFSSQELSRSYWLVTHKIFFRNILIGLILLVDCALIFYAVTGFGSYIFFGSSREQTAVFDLAQRLNISTVEKIAARGAQPLLVATANVFDSGNGSFDFATEVQNPNPEWYVLLTYHYAVEDALQTPSRTTYVMPNERKFLTALGQRREEASIVNANLVITNQQWHRINPHEIENIPEFVASHLALSVENPEFTPSASGTNDAGNIMKFEITNNSPYNYWAIPLQVVLMQGGTVQGVEEVVVRELRTGQKRTVDLRNFTQNLVVDEILVLPSVDIFDPGVYMNQ